MPPPIEMTAVQLYGEDFEIPKIIADAAHKHFHGPTDSDVERVAEALAFEGGVCHGEPALKAARCALSAYLDQPTTKGNT